MRIPSLLYFVLLVSTLCFFGCDLTDNSSHFTGKWYNEGSPKREMEIVKTSDAYVAKPIGDEGAFCIGNELDFTKEVGNVITTSGTVQMSLTYDEATGKLFLSNSACENNFWIREQ